MPINRTDLLFSLDMLIFGSPMMPCSSIGIAGKVLEETELPILSELGWLASRSMIPLGMLSGIPLLVYSLAKTVIAKGLNGITFNQIKMLNKFSKFTEKQFMISAVAVSALPLFILSMPKAVKMAYQFYGLSYLIIFDNVNRSRIFQTMEKHYELLSGAIVLPSDEPRPNVHDCVPVVITEEDRRNAIPL